jgi:phage baseplate assembly protein W
MIQPKAISLPFSFGVDGGVNISTNDKKIWQDRVVITVMTRLGERVMRPVFGSQVGNLLFENANDAFTLATQIIENTFSSQLPSLKLKDVEGIVDPYDGSLNIEIRYSLTSGSMESPQDETVTIKTAILSRAGEVLLEVPTHG